MPSFVVGGNRRSIDLDWRFHLGDPLNQDLCPPDAFLDFNDSFCEGWGQFRARSSSFAAAAPAAAASLSPIAEPDR